MSWLQVTATWRDAVEPFGAYPPSLGLALCHDIPGSPSLFLLLAQNIALSTIGP